MKKYLVAVRAASQPMIYEFYSPRNRQDFINQLPADVEYATSEDWDPANRLCQFCGSSYPSVSSRCLICGRHEDEHNE